MKLTLNNLLLILLCGCSFLCLRCSQDVTSTKPNVDQHFFVGQWWLDSSSHSFSYRDKLFILENGDIYLFDGSDGGSCRKFKLQGVDTIVTEYDEKLYLQVLDSNNIQVSGQYSDWEDFYRRIGTTEDLPDYRTGDSLRKMIVGFWKTRTLAIPFDMPNAPYYNACLHFTMQVRDDGKLVLYPDNNLDSGLTYSYQMQGDGFFYTDRCVVSNADVLWVNDDSMKIYLGYRSDTMVMDRKRILE